MKIIITFILLLGLSGCGFVFRNFNEDAGKNLTYGMAEEEVSRTMGAPRKKSTMTIEDKKYEVWEYPVKESEAKNIKPLGTFYYKVFFLDGKVAQWQKDKVYAQPSYEAQETIAPERGDTANEILEPKQNLK
jgi:hypothetical protein